ncbi:hypothetical protein Glove_122g118 [Diversispora epigaea]|uniref:HTH CENPB-type domain-containing protein n=1 Tax=Diversispora epigaea TaxID=1348612 RepID=A0A397IZ19_9GLOM|nr:hypothetical protein Glove_122g118 [Diversispora epigaea]
MIISDLIVKEKGCQFAQALAILNKSITFSNRWTTKFKQRNGLKKIIMHSEEKIKATVLLCSNSTGFHKLCPLVIVWIRSDIWEQWLRYINDNFHIQGRKILLLVDNAASHIILATNNIQDDDTDEQSSENDSIGEIDELQEEPRRLQGKPRERLLERQLKETPGLSNITIHFLPLNMTAHIQPMDAGRPQTIYKKIIRGPDVGIIHNFKSKYKKLYCRYLINQFEKNQNIEEYTRLINQPAKTEDALTDKGIIEIIIYEFHNSDDKTDEELSLPLLITMIKAIDALKKVISYQESLKVKKGFNGSELIILQKKFRKWCSERDKNKK